MDFLVHIRLYRDYKGNLRWEYNKRIPETGIIEDNNGNFKYKKVIEELIFDEKTKKLTPLNKDGNKIKNPHDYIFSGIICLSVMNYSIEYRYNRREWKRTSSLKEDRVALERLDGDVWLFDINDEKK